MITEDDVKILTAHLPAKDHEFMRGYAYLKEELYAIVLTQVDPAWGMVITHQAVRPPTRDGGLPQAVCSIQITVKGVIREGVGMQAFQYQKNSPEMESGEAEKGAATDAFKRAARMFGVGQYLTSLTPVDKVRDIDSLARWLGESSGPPPPRQNAPSPDNPADVKTLPEDLNVFLASQASYVEGVTALTRAEARAFVRAAVGGDDRGLLIAKWESDNGQAIVADMVMDALADRD